MSKLGENVGVSDTLCLDSIKVVPNPYKASSKFNETSDSRRIRFTNLPTQAQISIYTVAGEHVTTFEHSEQFDGNAWWNLRTGNSQEDQRLHQVFIFMRLNFLKSRSIALIHTMILEMFKVV